MPNPIKTSDLLENGPEITQAIDELVRLREEYRGLLEDVKKNASKLKTSISNAVNTGNNTFKGISKNVDELTRLNHKYQTALKSNGEEIAKVKAKLREYNREKKLESQYNNSAVGSHNRLSAAHSLELIKLKKLSRAQREYTKEGRKQVAIVKALSDQLKKIESSYGSNTRNVGNYNTVNKNLLGTLKRLAAVYLSVEGIKSFGRLVFRTTREVNSLNSAYKKVIASEVDRADAMKFLNDVSERYGTNINTLRRAYLRFTAATKNSNLTLIQRKQIFDSLSKATTALELGTEKTDRVFNAVEQIMSKGVVSSEELRQQLGDSLPGSLNIMASALGVTTLELSKMLSTGKVLSEDAMPKFAAELEKVYGLESIDRIDNLSTAMGRFETSIINTIAKLEASSAFKDFYDTATKIVNAIGNNIGAVVELTKVLGYLIAAFITWNITSALGVKWSDLYTASVVRQNLAQRALTITINLGKKATVGLSDAMRANPIGFVISLVIALVSAYDLLSDAIDKNTGINKKLNKISNDVSVSIEAEKLKIDGLFKAIKNTNTPLNERNAAYKKLKELYPEYLKNIDLETASLGELKTAQYNLNKEIEKKFVLTAKNKELDASNERIAKARVENAKLDAGGYDALQGNTFLGLSTGDKGYTDPTGFFGRKNNESGKEFAVRRVKERNDRIIAEERRFQAELDKVYSGILDPRKSGRGQSPFFDTNGNRIGKNDKKSGGGNGTKSGGNKYAKRELELSILKDQYQKELGLLDIHLEKLKDKFKKYGLDVAALEEYGYRKREKIIEKYARYKSKVIKKIPTLEAKGVKETYDTELKSFKLKARLAQSEFELLKKSEREKTVFKLKQKREEIKELLRLDEKYKKGLSETDKKILKNNVQRITNEINATEDITKDFNIYEKLGFDNKQEAAIRETMGFVQTQMTEFFSLRTELADKRVESADREVDAAQNALNREVEYQTQGFTSNVELKERELAAAQRIQKKAQKEQEKARRAELAAQTLVQGANLITGASKVIADGGILGVALLPLMFGAFIAAKVKAFQLTKKEYSKGGYEVVGGGTHKSGNDTDLGFNVKGKRAYAEKDEGHMILRPSVQRKYSDILPSIYQALDNGTFNEDFGGSSSDNSINIQGSDMSGTESLLGDIKNQNNKKVYFDGEGNKVVISGNITTTYV